MGFRLWLKEAVTARKQLSDVQKTVAAIRHDVDRLSRSIDELELDMDSLYDKVKTALGRISQRDRRAKADEPKAEDNGRLSAEKINQMILDGIYDGGQS